MDGQFFAAFLPILIYTPLFVILFVLCLRRQECPDCGDPMSALKRTRRQWIEGGYLCPNCGCECNLAGKKVPTGAPGRRVSVVEVVGLTAALTVAAILLYFGFIRITAAPQAIVAAPAIAEPPPPLV